MTAGPSDLKHTYRLISHALTGVAIDSRPFGPVLDFKLNSQLSILHLKSATFLES